MPALSARLSRLLSVRQTRWKKDVRELLEVFGRLNDQERQHVLKLVHAVSERRGLVGGDSLVPPDRSGAVSTATRSDRTRSHVPK